MVSQEQLEKLLLWAQCLFLAGGAAMLAHSGFGLMEI